MEHLDQFHFIRPLWLLAILPALIVAVALLRANLGKSNWSGIIAPHLLQHLIDKPSDTKGFNPLWLLLPVWLLVCIALAGPTWSKINQPLKQDLSAAVFVWDLSPSMMAKDLQPSRTARAKYKLIDLLDSRGSGLTGLVAYAGEAHIVTPLTDDAKTVKNLLNGLSPEMMPVRGSNPEMALEQALQLLNEGGVQRGDIVFITDGIDAAAHDKLTSLLKTSAHRVTVWGFGTEQGAPIPLGQNQGFAKQRNGEIIITKRDDYELSEAAVAMSGLYIPFSSTNIDVDNISASLQAADKSATKDTTREFDQWQESGYYLIFFVIPFMALAFRRGWLLSMVLIIPLAQPKTAHAGVWQDLWLNKDQQAQQALESGDLQSASKTFQDPEWKAYSEYKQQNFETAADLFNGDTAKSWYNKANALTQLEQYDEALSAYDEALKRQPNFEEAKHNKAITEKLKTLKEQQKSDSNESQDGKQQQDENGESSDDQSQNQQDGESQQDSENQQGEPSDQQNQGEQDQQQNSGEQSDGSPEESNSEQSNLTDEQQKALEDKYGQQEEGESSDEENPQPSEGQETEQPQEEESDTAEQDLNEQEKSDTQPNGEQQSMLIPQAGDTEEQQALEQWLRKVPDDPSGLLRNKFYTESRKRSAETKPPIFSFEDDPKKRW